MKTNLILSALMAAFTLYGCQGDRSKTTEANDRQAVNTQRETPVKMIEQLVGEWQLDAPAQNAVVGQNVGHHLEFTEEARYMMLSSEDKVDSGAYRMNEQLRNLYLESEAGGEPREYEVQLQQDVLTLKPKEGGQDDNTHTSYTYRRVGQGSISPDKRGENH